MLKAPQRPVEPEPRKIREGIQLPKRKQPPPPESPRKQGENSKEWRERLAGCTILEGDCRKLIKQIPDGSIDLVILDPPYGKDYQSHRTMVKRGKIIGDQTEYEALCLVEEIAPNLFRVLKADAHCYCFCDSEQDVEWIAPFTKAGFKVGGRLMWLRGRTMGDRTGQRYVSAYETVWFFTKGNRKLNGHPSNVIRIPKSSRELHPTQKNVYGLSELIEASSDPGEVVLDPFAGSGSTGAACRMCPEIARKVILMEIDPEHAKVCRERMRIYGKVEEKLET